MKTLSAILTAAALAVAMPANAQKIDLSAVTCKQFMELPNETISYILMWMTGYYSDEDAPPVVDLDKMKKDAEKLAAYCAKNPDTGLITAAEETFEN